MIYPASSCYPVHLSSCQTVSQVAGQSDAQVLVGAQLHIVHVLIPAAAPQLRNEAVDLLQIAVAQRSRIGEQFGQLLQSAEQGRFLEREIELGAVHDVKDNHFVPLVTQVLEARENLARIVEEVAEQNHDRAAVH